MTDILLGTTDYTKTVFIPDPASTDGSGKTGLVAADLTVSYTRVETDNDVVVTDVTGSLNNLTALTDAHTDWGVKEVSSTLAPGLYRLDIADAVFATGAWSAVVYVMITTSAAAASPIEFDLVAFNKLDGVRLGLTALPNAAADAAGGLPISDAGGLDLDGRLDAAVSSRMATYTQPTGFLAATFPSGTVANTTNITAGTVTTATNVTNISAGGIVAASFGANAITAAKLDPDVTTELQAGLATSASLTTVEGKIDTIDVIVDAILVDTAEIGAAGAGLTAINLPDQAMNITGNITGNLSGSVGSVTGNVGGTINGLTATALKDFFDTDSTTTYASAVAGSVVKEISDNAAGATITASAIADEVQTRTIAAVTTVNGLAANSVTAAALAVDAGTEIGTAVWATTTRLLTAGTNIVLAKGTGVTGFNDLSAAEVNAEADTALADYDGPTHAEVVSEVNAVQSDIAALNNLSAAQVNAEVDTALSDVGLTTIVTGRIDAAITSRLADASYAAPDNASIAAIKSKTDQLVFGVANTLNVNIKYVNQIAVDGAGTSGDPWGPA
jgi:hypothetical protein